jgi:hypothetical protein
MTLCHDSALEQTYYAKYQLLPATEVAHQRAIKRPSFIQSDFFAGKNVNSLYSRNHQFDIFSQLIIGEDIDDDENPSAFLSRGNCTKQLISN